MAKILVIEDDPVICENIVEILDMEGFETIAAHDGNTGMTLAQSYSPDLVLCDIMMPGIDGYQVLMELRDNPVTEHIPFVFLTAKADQPSVRYGMELGADDYLTKPFSAGDLLAAINTRLEKHRTMLQRHAQKLEDLRGNIFSMLPHEMRTPLASILAYAEMLMWDTDILSPQRIGEISERIFMAGTRLNNVIENFLVYAQIELAKTDPDRLAALREQVTDYPDHLTTDVASAAAEKANRESDLQVEVADAQPVQIAFDSLQKTLQELIGNAFKFSDPGSPVQVTATVVDQAYQWTVCNQGQGMTPDQIASIGAGMQFERRLFEHQGAGLGLTIAQQLIALHGGELVIESEPGVQTTVRVTLPFSANE